MLHVLDHADDVHTGDLSQSPHEVFEHFGIRLLYINTLHNLNEAGQTMLSISSPDLWHPIEDWKVD